MIEYPPQHRKPGLRIGQFRQLKKTPPDCTIDLHGLTIVESGRILGDLVSKNHESFICRVIHGKGTFTLAAWLREWACSHPRCAAYWPSQPHDLGSTNIYLYKS